jgi:pimeloyl-ACP methyl ester carboxylesterase
MSKRKRSYSFRKLFDGEDIRVFYFGEDKARVMMTFTRWANSPPGNLVSPTVAHVGGLGFVGFAALKNHRWQTPELPAAFEAVNKVFGDGKSITTFGVSMGGTGAVLASQFIGVEKIVAVSPRPAPAPRPFVSGLTLEEAIHNNPLHDPHGSLKDMIIPLAPSINNLTETNILYDPFFKLDLPFIDIIEEARGKVIRWPLPFAGHTPLQELKLAGLNRQFMTQMFIDDDFDAARDTYRQARSKSGLFEFQKGVRMEHRSDRRDQEKYIAFLTSLLERYGNNVLWLEERAEAFRQMHDYVHCVSDYQTCFELTKRKKFSKLIFKVSKKL